MAFLEGTPTKRVHLTVASPAGGGARAGTVRLTPSVPAVVVDGIPVTWTGSGTYNFNAQGKLVDSDGTTLGVELLDNSAPSNPDGWLWQAIIYTGRPRAFYFTLEGAPADVDLDELQELDPEAPKYVAVPGLRGLPGEDGAPGAPGSPGAAGAAGASAYQVAVTAGFVGTEAEWLASLIGPAGEQGLEGPQPALGAAGAGPTIALRSDDATTNNARTPTVHAASHGSGGSDALAPADIGAETSGAAAAAVTSHVNAVDPHGDRAWANTKFATQLDLSTLGGTVNDLSTTVVLLDGYLNNALTRIQAIEQGTAYLAGGHFTDDVEVIDAELTVRTTSGDIGRLRPTPWLFNVTDPAYGAKGDAKVIADGAITTGTAVLTSPSNGFASATPGMYVSVKGAGPTGVTTHIAQIASKQNDGQVTLAASAATSVTGAIVIFGTDDTAAIQAAVTAAETYLATHTYAQVFFPPRPFIVAGALNNTRSGNGQIVFGPFAATGHKRILEFRGETDGAAAVRHWQQTIPQHAGSCLLSLGVFSSTSAQISNINADGNPAVLCGPNEGWGYGVAAAFSNMQVVIKNLAILTTHSAYGLTYGAANLYGVANAHIENFGYGTAGVVPGSDYTSPGVFGSGLSIGLLLPAPGNNDHIVAKNIGCGGGYTYAAFVTEHLVMDRYMALYCWAGLVVVGNYFGSVGSVHALKVLSASIEVCISELYIMGGGSSGIGPIIDIDQLSTESGTPNIAGQAAHMAAARGIIRWTGLFNEGGLTHDNPTGIESVNAQAASAVRTVTGTLTARPIDRVLKANAADAAVTVNLPSAAPNPVIYTVIKSDATGNTVTIDPAGSETINGSATRVLSAQWETATLRSDGANWILV